MSDRHEWDAITYRSRSRQRLEYKLGAPRGYFHRHPTGKGLPHEVQGEVCAELLRLVDRNAELAAALSAARSEIEALREWQGEAVALLAEVDYGLGLRQRAAMLNLAARSGPVPKAPAEEGK